MCDISHAIACEAFLLPAPFLWVLVCSNPIQLRTTSLSSICDEVVNFCQFEQVHKLQHSVPYGHIGFGWFWTISCEHGNLL